MPNNTNRPDHWLNIKGIDSCAVNYAKMRGLTLIYILLMTHITNCLKGTFYTNMP